MKSKTLLYMLAIVGIAVAHVAYANAQSGGAFQIQKSVIANAGGRASGGAFVLNGTAGQAVAGTQSHGGAYTILSGFWASAASTAPRRTPFDFDGDGKTDIGIYRATGGEWWYQRSSTGQVPALQFGAATDKIAPVDFTGDGKSDIAFWRPSTGHWYVLRSEDNSYYAVPFGTNGDIPAPADFDGDAKADLAVFRPSN